MGDWQSYRLQDFIPFSPEIYWRLIERVNETFWPLHILTIVLGAAALLLALSHHKRFALLLLAPVWLSSGIIFHLTFYAELNWAAPWFGWAFLVQAALLLAVAAFTGSDQPESHAASAATWIGTGIAILGLLGYPLIGPVFGAGPTHAEAYGLHPDPTAITSLGVLILILRGHVGWLAVAIPALWCLVATLTLIPLEANWAALPVSVTIIALIGKGLSKRRWPPR